MAEDRRSIFIYNDSTIPKKKRIEDGTELSAVYLLIFLFVDGWILTLKKKTKQNITNEQTKHSKFGPESFTHFPNSLYLTQWKALPFFSSKIL